MMALANELKIEDTKTTIRVQEKEDTIILDDFNRPSKLQDKNRDIFPQVRPENLNKNQIEDDELNKMLAELQK
jgi:hypothetical protein